MALCEIPAKEVLMRRAVVLAVLLALALAGVSTAEAGPHARADARTTATPLQPEGGSGVHGIVVIRGLPQGGSLVGVLAFGLEPNTEYGSFYYDDDACQVDPELVGTFTSNAAGIGFVVATIDEDPDEVGSVSVRTPDYTVLFACADTPGAPGRCRRYGTLRRHSDGRSQHRSVVSRRARLCPHYALPE
jgi:hypothetical protein